jgi:hypothetical protein
MPVLGGIVCSLVRNKRPLRYSILTPRPSNICWSPWRREPVCRVVNRQPVMSLILEERVAAGLSFERHVVLGAYW